MKKCTLSLLIALVLASASAFATVHTVSNNENSPGQFSDLSAAITAATAGDTIYVSGSPTTYGNITINKQLVLIGSGYNPNNQFNFNAQLGNIALNGTTTSNPSGTQIMGFYLNTINCGSDNVNNVTVKLNRVTSSISLQSRTLSGWIIRDNIVNIIYGNYQNSTNILIFNNFILNSIQGFESNTVTISNNIFSRTSGAMFSNVEYAIVTNNIVYNASTAGCNYCTFNNNISIGGAQTTFIYDNNTGQNNFEDVDPQFINVASATFSYDFDYHLSASSPGIDAGTDGTDIGIYGGIYPFPSGGEAPYQTSPVPPIPQVINMNILNSVLPVGGTLQVDVEGKSQL